MSYFHQIFFCPRKGSGVVIDYDDLMFKSICTDGIFHQIAHRVGGNQKGNQQSTYVDQKSIETVFLIAICRQWQSKTLFLLIFDLRSTIVLAFSIAAYPVSIGYNKVLIDLGSLTLKVTCWVNFMLLVLPTDFFSTFLKNSFRNTIRVSNSFNQDQELQSA